MYCSQLQCGARRRLRQRSPDFRSTPQTRWEQRSVAAGLIRDDHHAVFLSFNFGPFCGKLR